MAEPDGLYGEAARAFFVRQQRRRRREQFPADERDSREPEQPVALHCSGGDSGTGAPEPGRSSAAEDRAAGTEASPPDLVPFDPPAVAYRVRMLSGVAPLAVFSVRDGTTMGRAPDVSIHVDHGDVSRHHAQFAQEGDRLTIMDLGSTNGTTVNDAPLPEHTPIVLVPGDIIRIGTSEVRLQVEEESPAG